jgi:hypothetical protein
MSVLAGSVEATWDMGQPRPPTHQLWQWLINPPVRITSKKKATGGILKAKQLGRRLYFIKTRWFVSKAGCGLQHRAENGSSTSRTREPNNVLLFCGNPCFKIITCVLFFVTRFETRDEGKITNAAVNVGQHLMQAKMQANFSFFSQAQGRSAVEMVGIVLSQCRERCNALAALP